MLSALIKSMRLRQWMKNGFVYIPLFFDRQLFHLEAFLRTTAGFFLFCFVSSAVYLINDIADIESDRQHPTKKNRPIPSGKLPLSVAWGAAIVLVVVSLALGFLLEPAFAAILALYFIMNLAYSKWLKHIPIVDVLIVSAGFVLRVGGGVTLITVERFSPWLYIFTTMLTLFMGFGKRRAELTLLAQGAGSYRKVLEGYSIPLLDQYVTIVSAATILSYSLYTFSAPNLPDNHVMMLSIPFVAYIIFRYLYLIQMTQNAGAPDEVLLTDRPIQIALVLTGLVILAVFYIP